MGTDSTSTEAQAPVEAPVAATPAPAPARARRSTKATKAQAKAKPARNAKATTAKTRSTIPAGMTRSRGALIPKATGLCAFTGAQGQCRNPGRWTVQPENVLSCTNHKNAGKRSLFAPAPRRRSRAKAPAVAA